MHGHKIHSLATVNYQLPRGETLFHLPLTNILENIQTLFNNNPKIFKDFFACKFVLAANHQLYSGNIQRLFGQQSAAAINSSNQQQQPTVATSSSNQQQQSAAAINSIHRQQQSTAAISSSNQQHPPATAINSSNQQQQSTGSTSNSNQQHQPAASTSSSNQQQQSAAAISSNNQPSSYQHHFHNPRRPTLDKITVPSTDYVLLEVDLGLAARLRVQSSLPRTIFVTFRFF